MRNAHLSHIIAMKFMNFRPEPVRGNQHGTEHQTSTVSLRMSVPFTKTSLHFEFCIMFHLCFCCDNTAITSLSTNKIYHPERIDADRHSHDLGFKTFVITASVHQERMIVFVLSSSSATFLG